MSKKSTGGGVNNPRTTALNAGSWLSKEGAVVLELAISIPVFLGLLYYIHDVPKYQRIHNRVKFCTICAVNMFQNMTMHRADKRIRKADLTMIRAASALPFFGGGVKHFTYTDAYKNTWVLAFFCFQGTGNRQAQLKWRLRSGYNPLPTLGAAGFCFTDTIRSAIPQKVEEIINPSTICNGLSVADKELFVIAEMLLSPAIRTPKGAKDHYKFLVLHPRPLKVDFNCFFDALTPFSPKPGLVTTSVPPN